MAPIFAISVAVNSGGKSTANEESTKSLDIILSAPITRESFITQKILSMISKTFFIATVHWISYFLTTLLLLKSASCLPLSHPHILKDFPIKLSKI